MLQLDRGTNSCRSQPLDVAEGNGAASPPEVILLLHVKPTFRRCAEGNGQPEGHRRAYPGTTVEEFRKRLARDPESLGGFRNRYLERLEAKLPNYLSGMRRVMHCHGSGSLVIVHVINIVSVAILKAEHHTPVSAHGDRPKPGALTGQTVEAKARQSRVLRLNRRVKHSQNQSQPLGVSGLYCCQAAGPEESLKSAMSETSNHIITHNVSGYTSNALTRVI
jgi:hypothetical protein